MEHKAFQLLQRRFLHHPPALSSTSLMQLPLRTVGHWCAVESWAGEGPRVRRRERGREKGERELGPSLRAWERKKARRRWATRSSGTGALAAWIRKFRLTERSSTWKWARRRLRALQLSPNSARVSAEELWTESGWKQEDSWRLGAASRRKALGLSDSGADWSVLRPGGVPLSCQLRVQLRLTTWSGFLGKLLLMGYSSWVRLAAVRGRHRAAASSKTAN